jgi:hypothetical protein
MRNSLLVTSDLNSMFLVDTLQADNRMSIGKNGVLLSVLGNEICASEVTSNLVKFVDDTIGGKKAFYEFDASDASKNQLCITYNDVNNVVYIIGITDIGVGFSGPVEVPQNKIKTYAVKMKNNPNNGLTSPNVVLVRLEMNGSKKVIRFYHLPL